MTNRRKIIALLLLGGIVTSGYLGYYYYSKSKNKLPKSAKIGVVIPRTGNLKAIGDQIYAGIEQGRKERPDDQIEVIYEDSAGDQKMGISAVNKLLTVDQVDYLVVNLTSVAMPTVPIVERSSTVGFMLSTHPFVLNDSVQTYRIFTSGNQEADLIVPQIIEKSLKSLTAIYVDDAYGQGTVTAIKSKLESTTGSNAIVEEFKYVASKPDFQSIVTKAKALNSDGIILIGYGFEYSTLFAKFAELNYYPTIFSNFSFSNRQGKEITAYKNKIIYTQPIYDELNSRTNSMNHFVNHFRASNNTEPDFNAAYGYDNYMIISDLIRSGKGHKDFLRNNYVYDGAMGKISILPNGDSRTDMKVETRSPSPATK